jgi:hypothetical protein
MERGPGIKSFRGICAHSVHMKAACFGGKGDRMTIPFEKFKARLLANPKVKAEYEALALPS